MKITLFLICFLKATLTLAQNNKNAEEIKALFNSSTEKSYTISANDSSFNFIRSFRQDSIYLNLEEASIINNKKLSLEDSIVFHRVNEKMKEQSIRHNLLMNGDSVKIIYNNSKDF